MKLLTMLLITIPALAMAQNPRELYERAVAEGYNPQAERAARDFGGARPVGGGGGKTRLVIDPFAFPSARESMLERQDKATAKREAHLARKAAQPKAAVSTGLPVPDSDGYRISNELGTVYCGIHGCWR